MGWKTPLNIISLLSVNFKVISDKLCITYAWCTEESIVAQLCPALFAPTFFCERCHLFTLFLSPRATRASGAVRAGQGNNTFLLCIRHYNWRSPCSKFKLFSTFTVGWMEFSDMFFATYNMLFINYHKFFLYYRVLYKHERIERFVVISTFLL